MVRPALALALLALLCGCTPPREVVVFHAASLARSLGEVARAFEQQQPGRRVRLEPSGSLVAARKLVELGLGADLIAVADTRVIDQLLRPGHAGFAIDFAANALVLAHRDHSRHTAELTGDNWVEILQRPGVRLARVNPDTAPLGYRTLLSWQLEERRRGLAPGSLSAALAARCAAEHLVADENELLALLQARAVDYAFVYRSSAEEHHLKITALAPEVDLGDADRLTQYASVRVPVQLRAGAAPELIAGAPVLYGLTVPDAAPHRADALALVGFLLGPDGQRLLERSGFAPLRPARGRGALPTELAGLVADEVAR